MSQTRQPKQPTPAPDPLIDEVRAIRRKISQRHGDDVDRLIEHLRQIERQHPGRVVQPLETNRGR